MPHHAHILHPLLHCADIVEDHLRQRLTQVGVPPRQALVIDGLSRMEPVSQVKLAREFGVAPASMSTMTVRLIDAGYVTREQDPDDVRGNLLRLTVRGRSLLADIHSAWDDVDADIEAKIGAKNAMIFAELAMAIRHGFGGRVPGAAVGEAHSNDLSEPTTP